MRFTKTFGRTFMVLTPWLTAACYGYYPVVSAPAVGSGVALTLNDSGSVALARAVGPSAGTLEGRLVSDTGNTYLIAMTLVRQHDGTETTWKGEQVAVDRRLVRQLQARRFSRGRTALASGLIAGGLVAAIKGFGGQGSGRAPGQPPPGGTTR